MNNKKKRKAEHGGGESGYKKARQWKKGRSNVAAGSIEPGDAGIWVTCEMNKEGKCTAESRDLFEEYAATIYGVGAAGNDSIDGSKVGAETDIESEIQKEVEWMRSTKRDALFRPVKVDMACVLFFKTRAPIEPVSFVHSICLDAFEAPGSKKHRWIKRLTPMTRMGKATAKGLDEVSQAVLAPVFHEEGGLSKKFAIRTTIRNHHVLKRDDVISQVAAAVGDKHSVDLKNYDRLILVEIYQNVCGMSVVGADFEKLKRFNLAEMYEPTPKTPPEEAKP